MIDYEQLNKEEYPFALRLAEWIRLNIRPGGVVDVGCGPGTYVYAMREMGVNAMGIDTDERVVGKPFLKRESMIGTKWQGELILCLEVMEHIPPELCEKAMDGLVGTLLPGSTLIFTAACPGQGGDGHVNCRPRTEWRDMLLKRGLRECGYIHGELVRFAKLGYHLGWFINNLIVMVKPL
jgi:SAM-dependent methyltransferase